MRHSGTVTKALVLLDQFLDGSPQLTLAELARRSGMHKTTILRLLASLAEAGLVERAGEGGAFRLGRKVGELARVYRRTFRLEDAVRPLLAELRARTGESASYYVADGDERVCLFRENSRHVIRHHLEEGTRLPLDSGVVGRVLGAFMGKDGAEAEQIRRQGFLVAEGREPDTTSAAVPVLDAGGRLIAALVVSGPSTRFTRTGEAVTLLREASRRLAAAMPEDLTHGRVPPPRSAAGATPRAPRETPAAGRRGRGRPPTSAS